MATKYEHPEWLKFSHFWRPVLWYTASCFERDVLRDCKNLMWDRWLDHCSGVSDMETLTPEWKHSEWCSFDRFWHKAVERVEKEPNGDRGVWVLTAIRVPLWKQWKVRAAAVRRERIRRETGS